MPTLAGKEPVGMDAGDEAVVAHHLEDLEEKGYTVVPSVLPPELVDELLADIASLGAEQDWPRVLVQRTHGYDSTRYYDLLNSRGWQTYQKALLSPRLLGMARGVLGDDCLLGTLGTNSIGPGQEQQILHADDGMYQLERPHKQIYLQCILTLCDFRDENGATRVGEFVCLLSAASPLSLRILNFPCRAGFCPDFSPVWAVPYSNHFDHYPGAKDPSGTSNQDNTAKPGDYEHVPVEAPKGSLVCVAGTTYHSGGENRTAEEVRHCLSAVFCAGWVRPQVRLCPPPVAFSARCCRLVLWSSGRRLRILDGLDSAQENFLVSIPQERAALFEDELQQLLGWLPSPTRGLGHIYTDERHRQGPLAHKLLNASGPEASAARLAKHEARKAAL